MTTPAASWRSLAATALAAVAVVVLVDVLAGRLAPPIVRREIADGVRDLDRSDPTLLVLGSSHARSFEAMGDTLAARTGGQVRTVTVPVEFGKFTAYDWVLQHRLRPLLAARRPDGTRARGSLRRLVLVTEWWDGCAPFGGEPLASLPSRGWTWADFVADVAAHGVTPYNRNYVQSRWRRLWPASALVQDRGKRQVLLTLRRRLLDSPADSARHDSAFVRDWRAMIEAGADCVGDPAELAALGRMLAWAERAGLRTTIVLFPRKPNTITPRALATTFARYRAIIDSAAARHGATVVDLTLGSPLGDDDFMADFDHVTRAGNEKFAAWALADALRDLATPDVAATGAPR